VETGGAFENVRREDIADDLFATVDIVVEGETIHASSTVTSLDANGKKFQDARGKDGALSNGSPGTGFPVDRLRHEAGIG